MTNTTGHYEQVDGRPVVRFERTFPHPVAAVWQAVTDPPQLERWFPTSVEFTELRAGAAIDFRFEQDAYPPMTGVFREVDVPRRLVFTWGEDELSFELSDVDGGTACRLAFTVVLDSVDKAARDSAGWDACLDNLDLVVAGERPRQPSSDERWRTYYEEYKRLGLPARAEILGH